MCRKFENRNPLPLLNTGDTVRMQPIDSSREWKEATVVEKQQDNPRSYTVKDNNGTHYRRDRQHFPSSKDFSLSTRRVLAQYSHVRWVFAFRCEQRANIRILFSIHLFVTEASANIRIGISYL